MMYKICVYLVIELLMPSLNYLVLATATILIKTNYQRKQEIIAKSKRKSGK